MLINYWKIIFVFFPVFVNAQWTELSYTTGYQNHAIDFINKDTGYFSSGVWGGPMSPTHTYLHRTKNGGATFQQVFHDLSNTPICQLEFFDINNGLFRRWQDNVIKTSTGGATGVSLLSAGSASNSDRFQSLDANQYFYGAAGYIYYTANGGTNWTTYDVGGSNTWINGYTKPQFVSAKKGFVFGWQGGGANWLTNVYRTTDSCQTVQLIYSSNVGSYPSYIKFTDSVTALMILKDLVLRTDDFGTSWDTVYTAAAAQTWNCIDVKENMVVIGGSNGKVLISYDSGVTFQQELLASGIDFIDVSIANKTSGVVYAACSNNKLAKRTAPSVSLKEQESIQVMIYPNPTLDIIYLRFVEEGTTCYTLDIFDFAGNQVLSGLSLNNSTMQSVDLSELRRGYYMLRVSSKSKVSHIKLLKQ